MCRGDLDHDGGDTDALIDTPSEGKRTLDPMDALIKHHKNQIDKMVQSIHIKSTIKSWMLTLPSGELT